VDDAELSLWKKLSRPFVVSIKSGVKMNERIKQLLKQSGLQPYYDSQQGDIENFAQLIVQECIQRCEGIGFRWHTIDSTRASGAKAGAFECAVDLKEHFGVE